MAMLSTPAALPGQTWSTSNPSASLYASEASTGHDAFAEGVQRTQQPIMTGTSVLGIKFDGGVLLAGDTLASYGSLARFDDISRLHPAGSHACVAAGGDLSDFQEIQHLIDGKLRDEEVAGDGHTLSPSQLYAWLAHVMYARRNKMNPYWNSLIVAGWEDNSPMLGYVDLLGTTYTSPTIATGFGAYLAQPLLRKATESRTTLISKEEARQVLEDCLRVLFYRDARSVNKFQVATITAEGVDISGPLQLDTYWGFAEKLRGYGPQTQ